MIKRYLSRGIFGCKNIYKFDYSHYNIDPTPLIIYLSAEKVPSKRGYFNNFIYGLNLNYLLRSQAKECILFLNEYVNIKSIHDWSFFIKRFNYLQNILRKYNIKYVSNVRKIPSDLITK